MRWSVCSCSPQAGSSARGSTCRAWTSWPTSPSGGRVTADEIRWYTVLNYNSRLTNILRIRYREPLVTNIVHKLMRVDPGRRKYCGRILDGSSYRDYLDEMKACLWD